MKLSSLKYYLFSLVLLASPVNAADTTVNLGFRIPTLGEALSFIVRFFFTVAALVALLYLLMGALAWITSGGSKESVEKAREKIQAAVIGLVLIGLVLTIAITLEQYVFNKKVCFGFTCDVVIPSLIQ